MHVVESTPPLRSTFVTVLAWIFIVLAGFSTFISILQNIMITLMFPMEEMQAGLNGPEARENMPAFFYFMFSNIRLFFFGFLVVTSTTLIASIGLLMRKNWARMLFIGVMSLGIVWNIVGVVLQQFMMSSMLDMPNVPGPDFEIFIIVIRVFTFLMALGMSILFGWIIKRLLSPAIKQEFLQTT